MILVALALLVQVVGPICPAAAAIDTGAHAPRTGVWSWRWSDWEVFRINVGQSSLIKLL